MHWNLSSARSSAVHPVLSCLNLRLKLRRALSRVVKKEIFQDWLEVEMEKQTLQGQYSGFLSRSSAFILDAAIVSITIVLVYWLIDQLLFQFTAIQVGVCAPIRGFDLRAITCNLTTWGLNLFVLIFPILYYLFFWILAGQTPAKYLIGVRVVRLSGGRITLLTGIRRLLGYLACFLSIGVGFLWVLVDDRRQGWHDKIAGTCVVYAWEAEQDEQFLNKLSNWIDSRRRVRSHEDSVDEAS
jgi:uncharacterized RDD family membrane protein YckC